MDLGMVLSVAQTLLSVLHSHEMMEICSLFGYKFKLEDLQRTISTVKALLRDAENKEVFSHEAKIWIEELKDAVYDADDLFDEFVTLAELKHKKGGKASKKLCLFFSSQNSFGIAYKMHRRVKNIRKKLDAIATNHSQFGFKIDHKSIRRRRAETCSYVYKGNVIGREDDVERIVSLLLDSNVQQDVSCLTIVGIGGLGKTTLAQLVYNDARVTRAFPLRLWTCVSDHEQEKLDMKGIFQKILASATGQTHEGSTMDWLQSQLREKLTESKYLLVLDDVWTENRNHWLQLLEFLLGGQRKSWIVVTTRSKETARIVGYGPVYELQGLSEENSWRLFEKTAFVLEQSKPNHDLVKIGREIVKRCASNPLAIRVVGSLLYGQDKSKWLSFLKIGLCNFRESQDITSILKFSYYQLEFPLKNCFTYCALFPKDFEIKKESLINLWMAQGCIIPLDKGQSIEDAGEEYISILLRRCFFQNVEHDEYGEIFSFKIHDIMHDIAIKVAGKEILIANSVTNVMDTKVRHLALMRSKSTQYSFTRSHIRSFLCHGSWSMGGKINQFSLKKLLANWMCLRVLDLSFLGIKSLPDSIGGLLHLRYLDLSHNDDLYVLPETVIKLYNLQTLSLSYCQGLKELPKNLSKLVKLRVLDTIGSGLTCMPKGVGMLSCLHTLTMFAVKDERLSWKQRIDQLEELKRLKNLKGKLHFTMSFPENATKVKEKSRKEGAYLRTKENLNDIAIVLRGRGDDEEAIRLMEELQPHSSLKSLSLFGCNGVRMPRWGMNKNLVTFLPNLIRLELSHIHVKYLTCLGNLLNLKELSLDRLLTLNCINEYRFASTSSSEPTSSGLLVAKEVPFYPSLEELNLSELPELEGWSLKSEVGDDDELFSDTSSRNLTPLLLPQLKKVSIHCCPNLRPNLLCPILEEISLEKFNEHLQIIIPSVDSEVEIMKVSSRSINTTFSSSSSCNIIKLWRVETDNVAWLNSVPLEAFQSLEYLSIRSDEKVMSLGKVGEVLRSCSSTLQFLQIEKCSSLSSLSGGLEHLTALKDLCILECHGLDLEGGREFGNVMAMTSYSLQTLLLEDLPLKDLPNWMQYLTTLQSLRIRACEGLKSLPNWIPKLTSLRKLNLWGCPVCLKQRCHSNGEDWPYIKHIPFVSFEF